MLWLLLATLGYGIHLSFSYGQDADTDEVHPLDRKPMPLDDIDVKPSDINFGKIRWSPAVRVSQLMNLPRKFLLDNTFASAARIWTRRKFSEHITKLHEWGILESIPFANLAVAFGSYFSVAKTEFVDRAIFNGSAISKLFIRPPSVNLIRLPILLQHMTLIAKNSPSVYVAVGDFRHWFHQLPCGVLKRFFGIAISGSYYLWCTFPMGFSWSPYAAQVAAWILFLDGLGELLCLSFLDDDELPSWIPLAGGLEQGFMTVYYDNYILVTNDEKLFIRIQEGLWNSFSNHKVRVKEHHQFATRSNDMSFVPFDTSAKRVNSTNFNQDIATTCSWLEDGFEYLGLHIRVIDQRVSWRVSEKRIKNQKLHVPKIMSGRSIAGYVGKVLSGFMPDGRALGSSTLMLSVIDCLRMACTQAHKHNSWDIRLQLPDNLHGALSEAWGSFLSNQWRYTTPHTVTDSELVIATDASDWGYGIVICHPGGEIIKQFKHRWTEGEKKMHIFIREVFAAERGIEKAAPFVTPSTKIFLVLDNTAACWAIERGYTGNVRAMTSIRNMLEFFDRIQVVSIVSAENVADRPSRNKAVDETILKLTLATVDGVRIGRRRGIVSNRLMQSEKPVAHAEDVDDLEWADCDIQESKVEHLESFLKKLDLVEDETREETW